LISEAPFRRATLVGLVALSAASLLGGILLAILAPGDQGPRSAVRPSARGRGALGHRALIELLRRLQVRVVVGRASRPEPGTAVVVAEPLLSRERGPGEGLRLRQLLEDAPRALLVLPKWSGSPDPVRRGFLASAELLPASAPAEVLAAAGISGQVTRVAEPIAGATWTGDLHGAPDFRSAQLLVSKDLKPVLSSNGRVLVGERSTPAGKLLVLADPDLLSNHGLRRGDDARLAVELIERLRQGGGVRFDESFHGAAHDEGPWRALLRFPLVLALLQALLAAALLLWGGMRRFGAPLPSDPPLPAGKAALIDSTAELLRFGGHSAHALDRYLRSSVQEVASALHAPGELRGGALDAWLDRLGTRARLPAVEALRGEAGAAASSPAALLESARRIHLWRTRMLHGSE
jgi:hypothetical protein